MNDLRRCVISVPVAAFACFQAFSGLSLAATEPVPGGVPVQMTVTVEPSHGKQVPTLYPQDVVVRQAQERRRVLEWVPLAGERAGLELFIVLDDSSSSILGSYFGELGEFINAQPASTAIGIGYMRNGVVMVAQELTNDHALAAKALRLPFATGGINASPYLALSDLIKRWPPTTLRRQILAVTDGVDRLGGPTIINPYLDNAIDDALRAGVMITTLYTPGAGHVGHSSWRIFQGQNCLSKIAEETGGEAYMLGFGPLVSFAPYLDEFSERLNHQYRLTFLAKPQPKAGFQPVKLSTEVPNAELVAPGRVYVPAGR